MQDSPPGVAELTALEADVAAALKARDESGLTIIGRGEITIALGWPAREPRYVCKRTPPFSPQEFANYQALVHEYTATLRESGVLVADTQVIGVERDSDVVAYLVQPLLDTETLGNQVLATAKPDPDHPMLTAVADTAASIRSTCSVDAQVSNFAWDGTSLTLIDVGTPFLWNNAGELRFDMSPFARMLPTPTRALAMRELTKVVDRWADPRVVATDVVANLLREGLTAWVDPMLVALNRRLDLAEPITLEEAQAHYDEDAKTFPTLVKLQRVERWWREKVRRQNYEWFIWSTYDT